MGFPHSPWERRIQLEAIQPGHEVPLIFRLKQLIDPVIIHLNRLDVLNEAILDLLLSLEIKVKVKGSRLHVFMA